jgi:hypothetical protein
MKMFLRPPIVTVTVVAGLVFSSGLPPALAAAPKPTPTLSVTAPAYPAKPTKPSKTVKPIKTVKPTKTVTPTSVVPTGTSVPGQGNCTYRPEQAIITSTPWEETLLRYDQLVQTNRGDGVRIAVIDTGFTPSGGQLSSINVAPGVNVAGEAPGYTADCGYEVQDTTVPKDATIGHGTNIVSILAAQSQYGTNFVGLVPNATVIPIKSVPDNGTPVSVDNIIKGINAAVDEHAQVINISTMIQATKQNTPALALLSAAAESAVSKGVVIVASAGNVTPDGKNKGLQYPAGLAADNGGCNGIISVGATDSTDQVWAHSNTASHTTVVAPGVDVAALGPGGHFEKSYYASTAPQLGVSGTSYSAAYVTATVALMLGMHPSWTPIQICEQLERTAVPLQSGGWNASSGAGRIDPIQAATSPLLPVASSAPAATGPIPAATAVMAGDRSGQRRALAVGAGLIGLTVLAGLVGFVIRRLTTTTRRG